MFRSRKNIRRSLQSSAHPSSGQVAETSSERLEVRQMLSGQSIAPAGTEDCSATPEISIPDLTNTDRFEFSSQNSVNDLILNDVDMGFTPITGGNDLVPTIELVVREDAEDQITLPFDLVAAYFSSLTIVEFPDAETSVEITFPTVGNGDGFLPTVDSVFADDVFRVQLIIDEAFESDSDFSLKLTLQNTERPQLNSQTGASFIPNDDQDPGVFLPGDSPLVPDARELSDILNATAAQEHQTQQNSITIRTSVTAGHSLSMMFVSGVDLPPASTGTDSSHDPEESMNIDRIPDQSDKVEFETGTDEDVDSALVDLFGSKLTGERTRPRLQGKGIKQVAVILPEASGTDRGRQSGEGSLVSFPIGVMSSIRDLLSNIINDELWLSTRRP